MVKLVYGKIYIYMISYHENSVIMLHRSFILNKIKVEAWEIVLSTARYSLKTTIPVSVSNNKTGQGIREAKNGEKQYLKQFHKIGEGY